MKQILWKKESLNHGCSTDWTIFLENGKIFVDSHAGWISEAYLEGKNVKLNPINAVPKYVKAKLKVFLKDKNLNQGDV